MKVKELLELWKAEIADFEIYQLFSENRGFHTDNLKYYIRKEYIRDEKVFVLDDEGFPKLVNVLDSEVKEWLVADEKECNKTIFANSCESADFESWYNDSTAKVLLIAI